MLDRGTSIAAVALILVNDMIPLPGDRLPPRQTVSCKEAAYERAAQPGCSSQAFRRTRGAGGDRKRLLGLLPGGKRPRMYSINLMRALHPAWFREDLERLFGMLAAGAI